MDKESGETHIKNLTGEQAKDRNHFINKVGGPRFAAGGWGQAAPMAPCADRYPVPLPSPVSPSMSPRKANGQDYDIQEAVPLLEWLANDYKKFGCILEFVTNKSQEGSQFCRGFGGIGGILRYQARLTRPAPP